MVQERTAESAHEEVVGQRVLLREIPQLHLAAVEVTHAQAARVGVGRELVVLAAVDLHLVVIEAVHQVARDGRLADDGAGVEEAGRVVDAEHLVGHAGRLRLRDGGGLASGSHATPHRGQHGQGRTVEVFLRRDRARSRGRCRVHAGHAVSAGVQAVEIVEAAVLGVDHDHVVDLVERETVAQGAGQVACSSGLGHGFGNALDALVDLGLQHAADGDVGDLVVVGQQLRLRNAEALGEGGARRSKVAAIGVHECDHFGADGADDAVGFGRCAEHQRLGHRRFNARDRVVALARRPDLGHHGAFSCEREGAVGVRRGAGFGGVAAAVVVAVDAHLRVAKVAAGDHAARRGGCCGGSAAGCGRHEAAEAVTASAAAAGHHHGRRDDGGRPQGECQRLAVSAGCSGRGVARRGRQGLGGHLGTLGVGMVPTDAGRIDGRAAP